MKNILKLMTFAILTITSTPIMGDFFRSIGAQLKPMSNESKEQLCNGKENLCNRLYNKVAQIVVHDATSTTEGWGNLGIVADQHKGIDAQLKDGLRAFKLPIHRGKENGNSNWIPMVTHALLERDTKGTYERLRMWAIDYTRKPLKDVLTTFKNFLDNNPREVITIILDMDRAAVQAPEDRARFLNAFKDSGITPYLYLQNQSPWPTFGELINKNKRLIVFSDVNFDGMREAGINNENDYIYGSAYNFNTINQINADSCKEALTSKKTGANTLFRIQHFITFGAAGSSVFAKQANDAKVLNPRIKRCIEKVGAKPNFVYIDFYDEKFNDIKQVIDELNSKEW